MKITDDFDLHKIILSGQCFRPCELADGTCRFIWRDKVLFIRSLGADDFEISCSDEEWESVWVPYFDLNRSYAAIVRQQRGKHPFVDEAMDFGRGLRILRQEPWETLVSFIISQRKNIPAIAKSIEAICERLGNLTETAHGPVLTFPAPQQLAAATADDLAACSLGYRVPYVLDAARRVASGELDLVALADLESPALLEVLMQVHGVGIKVANCTALFSYGRVECAPVDVWIARAIEEKFGGNSPFELYGQSAGIIQQYIFYRMRQV